MQAYYDILANRHVLCLAEYLKHARRAQMLCGTQFEKRWSMSMNSYIQIKIQNNHFIFATLVGLGY